MPVPELARREFIAVARLAVRRFQLAYVSLPGTDSTSPSRCNSCTAVRTVCGTAVRRGKRLQRADLPRAVPACFESEQTAGDLCRGIAATLQWGEKHALPVSTP